MRGISVEIKRGSPYRPLTGLYGIEIEYSAYATAKVISKRGTGLRGVTITLPDNRVFVGDNKGNVALPFMNTGDVLIVRKGSNRLEHIYGGEKQFTIVIYALPLPR